jgi:hypothetical protein
MAYKWESSFSMDSERHSLNLVQTYESIETVSELVTVLSLQFVSRSEY